MPFAEKGEGPRCQRRHRSLPVIPKDAEALLDMHSSEHVARRCKHHRIPRVSDQVTLTPSRLVGHVQRKARENLSNFLFSRSPVVNWRASKRDGRYASEPVTEPKWPLSLGHSVKGEGHAGITTGSPVTPFWPYHKAAISLLRSELAVRR